MPLNPGMPREAFAPQITNFSTVVTPILAIICAAIFSRKIRKHGYNGPLKFFNDPDKELWVFVIAYMFFCIVRNLLGIFYAAVFLRTGSVVLPAFLHFFLDITVMTIGAVKPEIAELHIVILLIELVCVGMGVFMLRKKKHAEIFKVLDRVWPMEKEEPAETIEK